MNFNFKCWMEAEDPDQMFFDFMKIPEVGLEEVNKKNMFGPVYHGTNASARKMIDKIGFNIPIGRSRTGDVSNGYPLNDYWGGIPAPIHHLGFGVYFTNSKSKAKIFNQGTESGLKSYYLDVPNLKTINFAIRGKMMKWWQDNGYDMEKITNWGNVDFIEKKRVEATINLTNTLKSKYDAVFFKGKGFGSLLDGDQICVYDTRKIYKLNLELDRKENNILPGDRFVIKGTNSTAKFLGMRDIPKLKVYDDLWDLLLGKSDKYYTIRDFKPDEVRKVYYDKLYKIAFDNADKLMPIINRMQTMSKEDAAKHYVDYSLSTSLLNNFPSNLAGRVLKKGERLK